MVSGLSALLQKDDDQSLSARVSYVPHLILFFMTMQLALYTYIYVLELHFFVIGGVKKYFEVWTSVSLHSCFFILIFRIACMNPTETHYHLMMLE